MLVELHDQYAKDFLISELLKTDPAIYTYPIWLLSAELEAASEARVILTADKTAWEAAKAQQEGQIQEARDSVAKAAFAAAADTKALESQKAAVVFTQLALERGDLARTVFDPCV